MHSTLKWPLLLALVGACSLVNSPSDHQGGDAGAPDADMPDVGTSDGSPPFDGGLDAGPDALITDGGLDASRDATPSVDAGDDAGDAGDDAGPPTLTASEYCARFAAAMCLANGEGCCSRADSFLDCETIIAQECADLVGPSPALPFELTFDEVKAAAAIETLEILTADCDTDVVLWALEDFVSPLIGMRPQLATCTPDTPLSARTFIHAALSCDRSGAMPDAMCQPAEGTRWQCERRRPRDGACYLGIQCLTNRCTPNPILPNLVPGTCNNGLGPGQACSPGRPDQCASLICQQIGEDWQCGERTVATVYCRDE